jgi:Zn-dependent protease
MRKKGRAFFRFGQRALSFLFPLGVAAFLLLREPLGYALFLLAAVILHEAGHLLAFFLLGEPPPSLSGRAGGLLLSPRGEMLSYRRELLVASAGPLFNLLAAVALIPALQGGAQREASFCFFALNLLSALFNLLPIAGFDGGRVFFCLSAMLLPPRAARFFCDLVSGISVLFFYFSALFLFLFTDGAGYSFLLAIFLLCEEGKRTGALSFRFESICEKKRGFERKRVMAGGR